MKIRINKWLIVVLVLFIVALSGCSNPLNGKYAPSLSIGEQIKTRQYNHNAKDFGKEELLDEILDASEKNDDVRIKELFSNYAIKEDKDLDSQIETYLKSFPKVNELKNRGCSEFGSHNRGSSEYNYLYEPVVFIIDNDGNVYRLIVMWVEGDSDNSDKQGIHSIQLISEERYNKHDYVIHSQDDEPGIFVYD